MMARKRELTKARIIHDLNIAQSLEIGILFSIIGFGGIGVIAWKFKALASLFGIGTVIIGMFALAFGALGAFMIYVALKDRHCIKTGDLCIFKDAVKRVEPLEGTTQKRVYFEEYTKLRGFGAVNLSIEKVNAGDKYFLIKLPSSNFVALAYPCSAFNIGEDVKNFVKNAAIAFNNQ